MSEVPESWNALRSLRIGDVCVIVGNGPSLKSVPADFLKRYDTFGSNRIYLMDDFHPTFYTCVNPLVLSQCIKEIEAVDCSAMFLAERFASLVPGSFPLHSMAVPNFSMRPWSGIYEGHTVTFVSMQLAFFLGYTTILLVGVDHKYSADPKRQNPNAEIVSGGDDADHFDPSYFGTGFVWNLPDLERSELSYHMAKSRFESVGGRIINLTEGTALDVFETQSIEDW